MASNVPAALTDPTDRDRQAGENSSVPARSCVSSWDFPNTRPMPRSCLFNGALSTYEKPGFVRDRKIGKHRWVVTKVVEPTS